MFVKKKKNRSGTTSVVIAKKYRGSYTELKTIGISSDEQEIEELVKRGRNWIKFKENEFYPELDFSGEEQLRKEAEIMTATKVISQISNVLINGMDIILNRVFDLIGFDAIEDPIFRKLVISRLSYPASKAATVEYLKNYFNEDVSLSRIYRYLDKLGDRERDRVQRISVEHTKMILGGSISVMFYDVTTLYFESDRGDDLRKPGWSKDGKHSNPQVVLGLLVSRDGYPLAYRMHSGNKYEGRTMLPVIKQFTKKYELGDFIVVADSGLMTKANIADLEALGYKYVIGARIKSESQDVKDYILSQPKVDKGMFVINKEHGRRLLIGYTDDRARNDAYNREKAVKRLEKLYKAGKLTKEFINNRGYNIFLIVEGESHVKIDYDRVKAHAAWDGLKGYLTNTNLPIMEVYRAYHNLWNVEKAFRIQKSKIKIRPMFHFTPRRIQAHICICFVALKVYKELERRLKLANVGLSVDKVIAMAKTITTIQVYLPLNGDVLTKTLIMERHRPIEMLFDEKFWGTQ